jgi:hypothetical protein
MPKSKNDRQHNGQKDTTIYKMLHRKLKIEQHEPHPLIFTIKLFEWVLYTMRKLHHKTITIIYIGLTVNKNCPPAAFLPVLSLLSPGLETAWLSQSVSVCHSINLSILNTERVSSLCNLQLQLFSFNIIQIL